jgi:8-oxo-dGTP pyrophosphatase MutT (NUDIX family)
MSLIPTSADSPVIKIGAVVVKAVTSHQSPVSSEGEAQAVPFLSLLTKGEGGLAAPLAPITAYEVLILQPIPKKQGEVPAFVLPRGSRQYRDAAGAWHDARDMATAEAHRDRLEPFSRALAREVEEEAGVTPDMLARANVRELGARAFQSRSKGVYPIHWFVVALADDDAATLTDHVPVDALSVRWATLEEIKAMAARGEFSAGYLPVIEEALGLA